MQNNDYLDNLPKVTEYENKTEEARKELFSFIIELQQKHKLTPSQEMFLLSDLTSYIASRCMRLENNKLQTESNNQETSNGQYPDDWDEGMIRAYESAIGHNNAVAELDDEN